MNEREKQKLERLNARYKRQNKAIGEKYDRVSATLPKGTVKRIQALNLTVNGLINDLVIAELERLEMRVQNDSETIQHHAEFGTKCPF